MHAMNRMNIYWFRRDLRLNDNHALYKALTSGLPVLPIFIFDIEILDRLTDKSDARVTFIYRQLEIINQQLTKLGSSLTILHGSVLQQFDRLIHQFYIHEVFANEDYEPYALKRDDEVSRYLGEKGITLRTFKDHVIFASHEVLKQDGTPYTVFTPYSRKWKENLRKTNIASYPSQDHLDKLINYQLPFPSIQSIGFEYAAIEVPEAKLEEKLILDYAEWRNFPGTQGTSLSGPHLRFGTLSIRQLVKRAMPLSETWLNELIWREFFMQIMVHFPHSIQENFHSKYNLLVWRNNEAEFDLWCNGNTGFAMVDAGMRELNATGFMHNRVRMITAGFLTKHLLIDWRWGEAYFASKLLDYELSSNVGNWQWAAGTGCDAAPYFRVFNPEEQFKKFDPQHQYVRKWVPEYGQIHYKPMLDHAFARNRAIETYKIALNSTK